MMRLTSILVVICLTTCCNKYESEAEPEIKQSDYKAAKVEKEKVKNNDKVEVDPKPTTKSEKDTILELGGFDPPDQKANKNVKPLIPVVVEKDTRDEDPPFFENVESFVVYKLVYEKSGDYSDVRLNSVRQHIVEPAIFRDLLPKAKYKDAWVGWKGGKLGILKYKNGKTLKILISVYGGFFKILGGKGYYFFENEGREIWDKEVRDCFKDK